MYEFMEQKVKAGDYVILTDQLNYGKRAKVKEVNDDGSIVYDGGVTPLYLKEQKELDTIAHPDYYNEGGIECFDVIRAALGTQGLVSFCEANIIKYAYRMKKKGKYLEDVRKIRDYADEILKIFNE